jgi:hypothetical protein
MLHGRRLLQMAMMPCMCATVGLYDDMANPKPGQGCHYHGYFSEALLPLQALVLAAWLGVQLYSNLTLVHEFLVCRPAPRVCKLANSAAYHARLLVPSTIRGVFLALRARCDASESNVCCGCSAASHHARAAHERDRPIRLRTVVA